MLMAGELPRRDTRGHTAFDDLLRALKDEHERQLSNARQVGHRDPVTATPPPPLPEAVLPPAAAAAEREAKTFPDRQVNHRDPVAASPPPPLPEALAGPVDFAADGEANGRQASNPSAFPDFDELAWEASPVEVPILKSAPSAMLRASSNPPSVQERSPDSECYGPSGHESIAGPDGGWEQQVSQTSTAGTRFALKPGWEKEPVHFKWKRWQTSLNTQDLDLALRATGTDKHAQVLTGTSCIQPFVMHPGGYTRLCWDLLSMFLLCFDILTIPFIAAFNPDDPPVVWTWLSLCFWSLDLVLSFLTGYDYKKQTVLLPTRIAITYLKSWFWLDLVILGLDWAFVVESGGGGSAARLGRSLRSLRFVRTLRLIRVAKLTRIITAIQDRISTERLSIWFGILKAVITLLIVNHMVACGWYTVGHIESEHPGWVDAEAMDTRTLAYRYATALHWSLAQFTPAPNNIQPRNVQERIYATVVLVTALVFFSAFLSTVTAGVVQLRQMTSAESHEFWKLRRYMRDWNVREKFRWRVIRYLEYALALQRQRVQESEVKLLKLLSTHLRDELRQQTFQATLSRHRLFSNEEIAERSRVFSRTLGSEALAKGDMAFECGEQGNKMIFISGGILEYFLGMSEQPSTRRDDRSPGARDPRGSTSMSLEERDLLHSNDWAGEPVLWTSWVHVGDLKAFIESHIVYISGEEFCEATRHNYPMWAAFKRWATEFLENLNALGDDELTDMIQRLFEPGGKIMTKMNSSRGPDLTTEPSKGSRGTSQSDLFQQTRRFFGSIFRTSSR